MTFEEQAKLFAVLAHYRLALYTSIDGSIVMRPATDKQVALYIDLAIKAENTLINQRENNVH